MRQTFTITIQSNQGISPACAFEISQAKAQKIIDLINPEINKKKKKMECSSIKLDTFFM